MSYTPGPWKHRPSMYGRQYRYVQIGKDADYTTGNVNAADARLISAAPEMYSLLAMMAKNGNNAARQLIERIGNEKV